MSTIKLRSGKYFDLLNPKPDQFTFYDIAGALSKICRFGGHCNKFYSVAEHLYHCVNYADICTNINPSDIKDFHKIVFIHDFSESFVNDLVKPLKNLIPAYSEIEDNIQRVIGDKFGVDTSLFHKEVKEIDLAMLIAEKNTLFSKDSVAWQFEHEAKRFNFIPHCWTPSDAEIAFTKLAQKLGFNISI